MLIAKDSTGRRCLAELTEKSQAPFFCPTCGSEVNLKKGRIVSHHFAHISKETNCAHGGETEIHMRTKLSIYKYLTRQGLDEVDVEHTIGKTRADVYFRYAWNEIAVEVQHSQILTSEIARRTIAHNKNGVAVLWIIPDVGMYQARTVPEMWKYIKFMYFGNIFTWDCRNEMIIPFKYQPVNHSYKLLRPVPKEGIDLVSDFKIVERQKYGIYPKSRIYVPNRKI